MKCFCTELEEGPLYADELEEGQWASLMVQTVKNLPAVRGTQAQSLGQEDPLGKVMGTHSSILAGEFHGQRSLVGCSPWGCKELDTAEQLTHTHVLIPYWSYHFQISSLIQQVVFLFC